jgi:outer membrane cobalamin receptor
MRGLRFHDGHGLILIDGQRVRGDLGAHGAFGISLNQLPLSMVERIEIVKGAASSLYVSDALAGVVNIITRRIPQEASTALTGSYGRFDVLDRRGVSAEDSTRDYYRASIAHGAPVFNTSGYFLHYGLEQDDGVLASPAKTTRHSLMGKWHTDITDNLSFNLNANYGRSRRDSNVSSPRYDREYDSYRFAGGVTYKLSAHEFNLKGYTYWQDYSRNSPGATHGYDKPISELEYASSQPLSPGAYLISGQAIAGYRTRTTTGFAPQSKDKVDNSIDCSISYNNMKSLLNVGEEGGKVDAVVGHSMRSCLWLIRLYWESTIICPYASC